MARAAALPSAAVAAGLRYCLGVYPRARSPSGWSACRFGAWRPATSPTSVTISAFRKFNEALEQLFRRSCGWRRQAGDDHQLGRVALDGTKMKAKAFKHKAMTWGRMKQAEKQIAAEVK